MGRITPDSQDNVLTKAEATLSAAGQTTPWAHFSGRFNLHISGTFTGQIVLERSFDGGLTAAPLTHLGEAVVFTAPASELLQSGEAGVLFRARAVALSAGAASVRLSQ